SWSGMRGIVSLAAALALPSDFPERNLVQFVSFVVVFGTLVIQGFTLGPLVRWLQVPEDRRLDREIALARRRALEAAIGTLDGIPRRTPMRFGSSIGLFLTFMKPGITAISSNSPIMQACA